MFVGNEVLTTPEGSAAAPFVLAAARDIKEYRDHQGYRNIPVGYSAADIADLRPMLQNYLACGKNASQRLDFYSLNAYEWCGQSGYTKSGYHMLQKNATNYPIPIFFSETGCNTPAPRTFEDQAAIFGKFMSGTWSGAMVYEWIEETNNYGLISYGPSVAGAEAASNTLVEDGFTRQGTPTPSRRTLPISRRSGPRCTRLALLFQTTDRLSGAFLPLNARLQHLVAGLSTPALPSPLSDRPTPMLQAILPQL